MPAVCVTLFTGATEVETTPSIAEWAKKIHTYTPHPTNTQDAILFALYRQEILTIAII